MSHEQTVIAKGPGGRTAEFSADKRFRYRLDIPIVTQAGLFGKKAEGRANFVMLNPSTADHNVNDPTITRVVNFARDWGYASVVITNVFALRSTDPAALLKIGLRNSVGKDNLSFVKDAAAESTLLVAGWGTSLIKAPGYREAVRDVIGILATSGVPLTCIDWTQEGSPQHPLYISSEFTPSPFKWKRSIHVQVLDLHGKCVDFQGDYLTTAEEAVAEALRRAVVGETGEPTFLECLGKVFQIERKDGTLLPPKRVKADVARRHRHGPRELEIQFPQGVPANDV